MPRARPRRLTPVLIAAGLLLVLGGCAMFGKGADKTKGWPVTKLYGEAMQELTAGNYQTAIQDFEKLESRFPFGRYAQQAQLEIAYAYYKQDEPDSAVSEARRFIKMYPRNPSVDYAYYLMGLSEYNRGRGLIQRLFRVDRSQRNQESEFKAFRYFAQLLRRFPNSRYARDARDRMVFLRGNLAKYELGVANYYMRRGAYVAAIERAKHILDHYQQTPETPRALAVMVKGYRRLGLKGPASDTLRVLKLNYPKDPALARLEPRSGG
ncbi:MAG TPA: outer membrane protein assembly factor BamD [Chromatiales bacterium]|nr:outer membrane protein assembly factor BamD [Chromatiales bacterium]